MSGPDGIDERFGTLVGELRSGEVTASPELRDRVRAVAKREPEPPAARLRARLPRRRLVFALVPLAAALAIAVGLGAFSSGGTSQNLGLDISRPAKRTSGQGSVYRAFVPHAHSRPIPPRTGPTVPGLNAFDANTSKTASGLAPSGSRHQLYSSELQLRVESLSETTKQAIRMTRGWGGYVLTVDYGSGQKAGEAYLVVRVPIAKVQNAIAKLTALGTIVSDHVSIQDVQSQFNQRYSRMQTLRTQITKLRGKLTDPNLTQSQRAFFEAAIAQRQAAIANLEQQQQTQATRTSFATVSLDLQTKKAAAVVPSKPSRIGQALHNIGRVLVTEMEIVLYVLLIGAPFAVLAGLVWWSRRGLRRRSEEQLLAR